MLQNLAIAYSYTSTSPNTSSGNVNWGVWVPLIVILVAVVIFAIVATWKMFQKAGKPGWAAIIPVYNQWVLFEISGKPGWWALSAIAGAILIHVSLPVGMLLYLVYFVLFVMAMLELAKRFGQGVAFAIFGLIIFSVVGTAIIAFGGAKYEHETTIAGPIAPPKAPTPPTAPQPPKA